MRRVHIVESKGGSCAHSLRAMAISQVGWFEGIAAEDCLRVYKESKIAIQRSGWVVERGRRQIRGGARSVDTVGMMRDQKIRC